MGEYILAVFSTRTSTMQFSMLLNRGGIGNSVVETPKQLTASCGVSVKFSTKNLGRAKEILYQNRLKNFIRFYYVKVFNGITSITPL